MSVFRSDALADDAALITGATGGIGRATAQQLSAMGSDVVITGRNQEKLEQLEEDLASYENTVSAITADITDIPERKALVEEAIDRLGSVTILVNSAGFGGTRERFESLEESHIRQTTEVNYTSTILLTQDVYQHMQKINQGSIINISSLSGLRGTYLNIPYSASKFALTGFTQSLALEAIEHGIRVNQICPGWVDTKMAQEGIKRKADRNDRSYEAQLQEEEANIPSGRISTPEEVASAVAFLATSAVGNMIGESLKISGGVVLR